MKQSTHHLSASLFEYLGWYGMLAVLTAYAGTTYSLLSPHSSLFLLLNGTGSAALAYHSYGKRDTQPMLLNIIWLGIALIAGARLFLG